MKTCLRFAKRVKSVECRCAGNKFIDHIDSRKRQRVSYKDSRACYRAITRKKTQYRADNITKK